MYMGGRTIVSGYTRSGLTVKGLCLLTRVKKVIWTAYTCPVILCQPICTCARKQHLMLKSQVTLD
jgi:hypothetical protein